MISIKRFLDQRHGEATPDKDVLQASLQMGRLLLDAIATNMVRGREPDCEAFVETMDRLARGMDEPPTALKLLDISSGAIEAMEQYARETTDYIREHSEFLQSIVSMLAETLADFSGKADIAVSRLQSIEQQIEHAARQEDMQAASCSLETCLTDLREAVAQQKRDASSTRQRFREQIDATKRQIAGRSRPAAAGADQDVELTEEPEDTPPVMTSYVAAFKLQRAEHIASRFGEGAKRQMLALISRSLKTVLGPNDRLLRWKGTSFIMFLNSASTIQEVRALLAEAVAETGQHYVEVGKKSALLSAGVDWIVFPQDQCPSLDAVFKEVDLFLTGHASDLSTNGAAR